MFIELKNKEHWVAVAIYLFGSSWESAKPILKRIGKIPKSREEVDNIKIKV